MDGSVQVAAASREEGHAARAVTGISRGKPKVPFRAFASIAAIGWLIDCSLYLGLTLEADLAPFTANLFSSAIASALVFTTARQVLFRKRSFLRALTFCADRAALRCKRRGVQAALA